MIETITGDDTLTLFGRVITDLATTDISVLEYPNEINKMKTGKNANTIYAKDETGNNATLVIRLMRGSDDDLFLESQKLASAKDYPATILATGQLVKRLGDGQGNIRNDVYTLQGGTFTRNVPVKSNVEGDTEQAVAVYNFMFAVAKRSIQ